MRRAFLPTTRRHREMQQTLPEPLDVPPAPYKVRRTGLRHDEPSNILHHEAYRH